MIRAANMVLGEVGLRAIYKRTTAASELFPCAGEPGRPAASGCPG